jgi:hypothetical protein
MSKKIWYSAPLKYYWNVLYATQKKLTPHLSNEQIFSLLRYNVINSPLKGGETTDYRDLTLSGLDLWRIDSNGNLLHIFFLDKKLRDLIETIPLLDLEGVRKYLYENGENKNMIYINNHSKVNSVSYNFGLHIPYEKDGYAFLLSLFENGSIELFFSKGNLQGSLNDINYNIISTRKDIESILYSKMFRLAINTIAYMNCYPDCVSEGVPRISIGYDDLKSNKNITLKISNKIIDTDNFNISKIPHFRKGYFRLLKSDYFTHKKGQIVYVTETMVKAKAKTVSTSDQLIDFVKDKE